MLAQCWKAFVSESKTHHKWPRISFGCKFSAQVHANDVEPKAVEIIDPWLAEIPGLSKQLVSKSQPSTMFCRRTLGLSLSGTHWQACAVFRITVTVILVVIAIMRIAATVTVTVFV